MDAGEGGYEYFPKPKGLAEFLLGSQQLRLPLSLADLQRLMTPEAPRVLELPDDLRQLNRPF